MMMFSLAGIPPLAGFFAKFYVFLAAMKAGLYALAVIGVLASVVGAYYYLAHRQGDVFRRARARAFEPMRGELAGGARRSPACSSFCSSSIRRRWSTRRRRPRSRCSDADAMRDPDATAAGASLVSFETLGSTNAEALRARPRGRARAAVDRRAAADRRARPARPRLGVGAGQSLREPAADRSGAAAARSRNCSLRGGAGRRTTRVCDAGAGSWPARLSLKWPNDLLLDGAQARRHPDRGGAGRAPLLRRDRHRHQLPRIIRGDTAYPATDLARAGRRSDGAGALFAALSRAHGAALAQWNRGARLCRHPRRLAGARRRRRRQASRVRLPDRELTGRFETLDADGRLVLRLGGGRLEASRPARSFRWRLRSARCGSGLHASRRQPAHERHGARRTRVRAARRRRRDRHEPGALRLRAAAQADLAGGRSRRRLRGRRPARHRPDHAGHPLPRGASGAISPASCSPMRTRTISAR